MVGNETLANYLLFAFYEYQGAGGCEDIKACFLAESDESAIAKAIIECKLIGYEYDIYQLISVENGAYREIEFDYNKILESEINMGAGI